MNLRIKQRMKAFELMFKYYNSGSKNKIVFRSQNAYFVKNKNKLRAFIVDKCINSGYSNAYYIQCAHNAASEELFCKKAVC